MPYTLDSAQLDTQLLDGVAVAANVVPTDVAWYMTNGNYFGLQTEGVVISQFFRESAPLPQITYKQIPRGNGQFAEVARYQRTIIKFKGTLIGSNQVAVEQLMDQMRKVIGAMPDDGGTLQLTFAGAARLWDKCYPTSDLEKLFDTRDFFNDYWVDFNFTLESGSFGRSAQRVAFSPPSSVSTSQTIGLSNTGSAPSDPIITIPVVAAGTLSQIVITNVTTGDSMTVAHTFSNGDTFEMNAEEKTVQVNGANVDFNGVFPSIISGDNAYAITFTGSGYVVGLTAQFYPRFL